MQVDENNKRQSEAGRGETRCPIVDAELTEREHGAPIKQRRLLEPRFPVEDGRDVIVADQHLARDLRVAGLIRSNKSQAIATEDRDQAIKEKENRER